MKLYQIIGIVYRLILKNGVGNIVTALDLKLDEYITKYLKNLYPEALIISEENKSENIESNLIFIIDPLDGTTNFTNNWPCSISIACILDNELICGVIYEIRTGTVYYAIKGKGAYRYNLAFPDTVLRIQSFHKKNIKLKKAVVSYDFPYGDEAFIITQKMVQKLYQKGASLKTVGPISLEILNNGLGEENKPHNYNNLCWHTEVRVWDVAAATCIIRELGSEIISLKDGNEITCQILSNPNEKIAFAVSNSKQLLLEIYNMYNSIIYNQEEIFKSVYLKNKYESSKKTSEKKNKVE